jgi:hypothetical protein
MWRHIWNRTTRKGERETEGRVCGNGRRGGLASPQAQWPFAPAATGAGPRAGGRSLAAERARQRERRVRACCVCVCGFVYGGCLEAAAGCERKEREGKKTNTENLKASLPAEGAPALAQGNGVRGWLGRRWFSQACIKSVCVCVSD